MDGNKIVLFANVKGGVGKSILCGLFASYLLAKGESVVIVDADSQSSLYRHRQRDIQDYPYDKPIYPILSRSELVNAKDSINKLRNLKAWILIDTPGNLVDDKLVTLFQSADFVIVPVHFDRDTVDATTFFMTLFRKISQAPVIFIPNRIKFDWGKNKAHDEEWTKAKAILKPYGNMTPRIKDSVAIERYSTVKMLESYQMNAVRYAFDAAIKEINE